MTERCFAAIRGQRATTADPENPDNVLAPDIAHVNKRGGVSKVRVSWGGGKGHSSLSHKQWRSQCRRTEDSNSRPREFKRPY